MRVLFVNCPNLNVDACTYLLLAQNRVQDIFEFEVCHHWVSLSQKSRIKGKPSRLLEIWADARVFGMKLWGANKAEPLYWARLERSEFPFLDGEIGIDEMKPLRGLIRKHEEWLQSNRPGYGGAEPSLPTIVITETILHGQYISNTVGSMAVVTLANWQKQFSPPSALEFILLSTQRLAARVALEAEFGSHYATRACLWDFTANVADVKSGILIGYICADCRNALLDRLSSSELEQFERLMSRSWLGTLDEPGSVASNLKRVFDYDLSTTRGLKLSAIDRCLDLLWSAESAKFVLALVGALLVWWLAKHNIKIELAK